VLWGLFFLLHFGCRHLSTGIYRYNGILLLRFEGNHEAIIEIIGLVPQGRDLLLGYFDASLRLDILKRSL
jgi:hypothetical protein